MSALDALSVSDEPGKMIIIHPKTQSPIYDKDGNPAYVLVYSDSSQKGLEIQRSAYERSRKRGFRAQGLPDFDDARDMLVGNSAARTAGWYLVDPATEEAIDEPWSLKRAREVFASLDWLRRQVDEYAADEGNFIKA